MPLKDIVPCHGIRVPHKYLFVGVPGGHELVVRAHGHTVDGVTMALCGLLLAPPTPLDLEELGAPGQSPLDQTLVLRARVQGRAVRRQAQARDGLLVVFVL